MRPLIVAEVAQSHDGSIGLAHNFIDAIADAGADVVKFQMHLPDVESSPSERFRVPIPYEEGTRQDYWRRTAFTPAQWRGLADHCERRAIGLVVTPFSIEAVWRIVDLIGPQPFWKVGSGQITNEALIRAAARQDPLRIAISTGLATTDEIKSAWQWARDEGAEVTLLQCTTEYPCAPEHVGMAQLVHMDAEYDCEVGLSDHSGTIWPSVIAAWMRASIIEVHVTLSPYLFGPDVSSSITIDQLKQLRDGVECAYRMRAAPFNKNMMAHMLAATREVFGVA